MSVSAAEATINRLRMFVSAGPRSGGAGQNAELEWVVARSAVGTARGFGPTLADAIANLEAQEAEADVDELM